MITSCGDRQTNIDDHSKTLADSIKVAVQTTEKLPEDWSDFYYCDNLDSAIKYPDKVHHLQLRNYDITKLPNEVAKFSKIEGKKREKLKRIDFFFKYIKISQIN